MLDVDDLHLEGEVAAGQRVIEVHGDPVVVQFGDHAGQFGAGGIGEIHHRAHFHVVGAEGAALEVLPVLFVVFTEAGGGVDKDAALVAGLEAEDGALEAGQQGFVTPGEGGRLATVGAVHFGAVHQTHGEMQGDAGLRTRAQGVSHGRDGLPAACRE